MARPLSETEHLCPRDGTPAPVVLCWDCTKTLARHLAEIPADLAELDTQLARLGGSPLTGTTSRTASRPLPYDARSSALIDQARVWAVRWTREAHAGTGELPPDTLPAMVTALRRHPWATHPRADALLSDLELWRGRVRRAIDTPPPRHYLGPCDALDAAGDPCPGDVYAEGDETACGACGAAYDRAQRETWAAELAGDQLVTASEAAGALSAWGRPVKAETVRQWASRGRVLARGHNRDGYPVYSFADCRTLAQVAKGPAPR